MSLTRLRGPADGMLELPITVQWGPLRIFDLSDTGQRRMAYRAVVRDGTPEVQETLLNRTLLLQEWPTNTAATLPNPVGTTVPRTHDGMTPAPPEHYSA